MLNSFYLDGVDALDKGDYEKAGELFLKSIHQYPTELRSYLCLGRAYFLSNRAKEAIPYLIDYTKGKSHLGNTSYVLDLLGQCYEADGNLILAMDSYKAAIVLNDTNSSAWSNLGILHTNHAKINLEKNPDISLIQLENAAHCIQMALAINKTNPMFLNSWASVQDYYAQAYDALFQLTDTKLGDIDMYFKSATESYKKALEQCHFDDIALQTIIKSNLSECWAQYAHYLYRSQVYEEAKIIYLQALELDPEYLNVVSQLGMCCFKLNDFDGATQYFLSVVNNALSPEDLADGWLNLACVSRNKNSLVMAEMQIRNAKKIAPEDKYVLAEEKAIKEAMPKLEPQRLFKNPSIPSSESEVHSSSYQPSK